MPAALREFLHHVNDEDAGALRSWLNRHLPMLVIEEILEELARHDPDV